MVARVIGGARSARRSNSATSSSLVLFTTASEKRVICDSRSIHHCGGGGKSQFVLLDKCAHHLKSYVAAVGREASEGVNRLLFEVVAGGFVSLNVSGKAE